MSFYHCSKCEELEAELAKTEAWIKKLIDASLFRLDDFDCLEEAVDALAVSIAEDEETIGSQKKELKAEKAKMALAIEKIETMLEYQERMNHIDNEDVCDALARCLEVLREIQGQAKAEEAQK